MLDDGSLRETAAFVTRFRDPGNWQNASSLPATLLRARNCQAMAPVYPTGLDLFSLIEPDTPEFPELYAAL